MVVDRWCTCRSNTRAGPVAREGLRRESGRHEGFWVQALQRKESMGDRDEGERSLDVLRPGGLLIVAPPNVSPSLSPHAAERGLRAHGVQVEPDGRSRVG